jgi:EpsI family protein
MNMLGRASVLVVCFVTATGVIARANRPEPVPVRETFDSFPMAIGDWKGAVLPDFTPDILAVLGVDDYVNRAYYGPERYGLGLYIGFHGSQRQGDSIHSPLNCMPGAGWEPVSKSLKTIAVAGAAGAAEIGVNRMVIQKGIDRQLVLYWYQSHGRAVANEYWSKLYLIRDAVRINRTDAALVRVIVPIPQNIDGGENTAEQQATEFVRAMYPLLPKYVPS